MYYGVRETKEFPPEVDAMMTESVAATEDMFGFVKKLVVKIGTFFGNQAAMASYIKSNLKVFGDLNKEHLVRTVLPRDLSAVGNALQEINEGLEKLRLGGKLEMAEFCSDTLAKAGITYERGRMSIVNFKSGNWGDGKDKTGLDHPMTYKKTVEEFGWQNGATTYAERFIELCNIKNEKQLIAASNRHYADVKNAMARGIGKNQAIFDKQVAIDQINQLNVARNVLLRFYYQQLRAIMEGSNIQLIGAPPKEVYVPDTWTGK